MLLNVAFGGSINGAPRCEQDKRDEEMGRAHPQHRAVWRATMDKEGMRAVATRSVKYATPSRRCQRDPRWLSASSQTPSRHAGTTVATCAWTANGA
jgi:hypothetical protein